LKIHARSIEQCEVVPEEVHDDITPDVRAEIHSRKKHGRKPSLEERWFDIFRLIFPQDPLPADPCEPHQTQSL
jgi:hypothetical protein